MPDYRIDIRDRDTGEWRPVGTVREMQFTTEPAPEPEPPATLSWTWAATLTAAERSARRFADAMRELADTARQGARNIRRLGRTLTMPITGPRNLDPADDTWQTDLCAAWLCGSCPSPAYCDCVCHGGTRL